MERTNDFLLRTTLDRLTLFDGFPYLATKVSPGLHHINLLPKDKPLNYLCVIAASQAYLNGFSNCLIVNDELCYYYSASGSMERSTEPPRGGLITFGQLKPFRDFPVNADISRREKKLINFGGEFDGCLFGDLTKGGHAASEDETRRLAGKQENGVPLGLVRCTQCGQWKGECFDQSQSFPNRVLTVHCLCQNDNLCAGCGQRLYKYKLNSNFFSEVDSKIWHVPGFSAFNHRCPEVQQ